MAHDHFYGICENKCLVEIKQDNIPGRVGKDLTGQTVSIASDGTTETTVTAGANAVIFSDYRERAYVFHGDVQRYIATEGNAASGAYSHAEGQCTTASGENSHAEGWSTLASNNDAHAEGGCTVASGRQSHAEGQYTKASGSHSHAEGYATTASGDDSHAEGISTTASGGCSYASGWKTVASGQYARATGMQTEAKGELASASGYVTIAKNFAQTVIGRLNTETTGPNGNADTNGSIFIIGNGTWSARANAFRVSSAGAVYGRAAYNSSGADYAEMWEIEGGNPDGEDWRGLFVTVNENNKISKANSNDYILGVISATPCVVGDTQSEVWHNMYLKDVFGEHLTETVEVEETTDEHGYVTPAHTETRLILNPDYDSSKEYISRDERPEWAAVGLMGKLIVIDDGTCKPGQFCKVADGGIATASGNNEGYRVLERKDENHIQILFR